MGDIEGAVADFNRAIKINPDHPEAFVNLGLLLLQQGRKAEAEKDFARSVALRPSVRDFIDRRFAEIERQ
jgi:Flp pilus assembly protein TadD